MVATDVTPVALAVADFNKDGNLDLAVVDGKPAGNVEVLLGDGTGNFVKQGLFAAGDNPQSIAVGDLNNDGWVDIVMNCNNGPAVILQNRKPTGNHWLIVDTIGTRGNRDGIGAQIRLAAESGRQQFAMVTTGSSYLSSNDKRVHFGLGASSKVKLLEVTWPSGKVQRLENLAADRILTVREP